MVCALNAEPVRSLENAVAVATVPHGLASAAILAISILSTRGTMESRPARVSLIGGMLMFKQLDLAVVISLYLSMHSMEDEW